MDSFHVHFKLSNFKKLGHVFRMIEVCVFFIFVLRVVVSFQLQFPVGEYAKWLLSIVLSHRFVFVVGNVIVITLFAKSYKDSHPDNTPTDTQDARFGVERHLRSTPSRERSHSARLDITSVEEDKMVKIEVLDENEPCFERSYSECLEVGSYVEPRRILMRTATEGCGGVAVEGRCDEVDALEGCGDGMSDEEFRFMVETFIAKQQRSLREEEKCLYFVN